MVVRVVEDHPDIAELLRFELTHAGFDVDVRTSNFDELLTADAWDGIDACVFDLQLGHPTINGGTIVLFVAGHVPDVRRIILTATPEDHLTPAVRAAAHLVMDKPTGVRKLTEALRAA